MENNWIVVVDNGNSGETSFYGGPYTLDEARETAASIALSLANGEEYRISDDPHNEDAKILDGGPNETVIYPAELYRYKA